MARSFDFGAFSKHLAKDDNGIPLPDVSRDRFFDLVPRDLQAHWDLHGLCSYGDGALWFIDPSQIVSEIRRFEGSKHAIPFARTSIGLVFVLTGEVVSIVFPQSNLIEVSSPSLNIWGFSYFRSPEKNRSLLSMELKEALEPKLGKIEHDTVYGLKTALALGGADEVEDYSIVNLSVYLDILASVHER